MCDWSAYPHREATSASRAPTLSSPGDHLDQTPPAREPGRVHSPQNTAHRALEAGPLADALLQPSGGTLTVPLLEVRHSTAPGILESRSRYRTRLLSEQPGYSISPSPRTASRSERSSATEASIRR